MRLVKQNGPPKRPVPPVDRYLRGGDVADELLADAVRALVLPVVERQRLVRRAVLEVELAAGKALRARERPAREERRDERRCIADARRVTRGGRVERPARDRSAQVAAELPGDARGDG